jgi:tetratricopeptide (TPR) repeat protein
VARTDVSAIDTGLARDEALRRASEFLGRLREGNLLADEATLDDRAIDVLHAACLLVQEQESSDPDDPLRDAGNLYEFIERASWPEPDFGEKAEMLADCAFSAWRVARKQGTAIETEIWRKKFLSLAETAATIRVAVADILLSVKAGGEDGPRFRPEDHEALLAVWGTLRRRLYRAPAAVRSEAEHLYKLLNETSHESGWSEERAYLRVEFAFLAGMTSRILFHRRDSWRWLERVAANIALAANSATHAARLEYHRLALRVEERHFDEVLELGPRLLDWFKKLRLTEDAVKCRFLLGAALQETSRSEKAIEELKTAYREAKSLGNMELMSMALCNLTMYYRTFGDLKQALLHGQRAFPYLQQSGNRVNLAKFRWAVGDILREQGRLGEAAAAYREAVAESEEIGTRNDSAFIRLALAEVLLDLGTAEEAELEIRAALPIIEEEKMVPEGYAALALLQESLRRRKIDRQALRNLHGYFQDEKS